MVIKITILIAVVAGLVMLGNMWKQNNEISNLKRDCKVYEKMLDDNAKTEKARIDVIAEMGEELSTLKKKLRGVRLLKRLFKLSEIGLELAYEALKEKDKVIAKSHQRHPITGKLLAAGVYPE